MHLLPWHWTIRSKNCCTLCSLYSTEIALLKVINDPYCIALLFLCPTIKANNEVSLLFNSTNPPLLSEGIPQGSVLQPIIFHSLHMKVSHLWYWDQDLRSLKNHNVNIISMNLPPIVFSSCLFWPMHWH